MSRNLQPRRYQSHVRRQPTRRDGPSLQTVQVLAACLMIACLAGIAAVSIAPGFEAKTLAITGARFTSRSIVASIVGFDGSPNLFGLRTDAAAATLARLPAVEEASVRVQLPSTIEVTLVEREPKLIWAVGAMRYAVDADGLLFGLVDTAGNPIPSSAGPLPTGGPPSPSASTSPGASGASAEESATGETATDTPTPAPATPTAKPTATPKARATAKASAGGTARPAASLSPAQASLLPSLAPLPTADPHAVPGADALGLPVVFDRRAADAGLKLGDIVDPVNLDAGYRLAFLTPDDVGTKLGTLVVSVDDTHGFTLSAQPAGWVAEFGFYATTVRETSIIPEQVRDLRSLLAAYGDDHVAWVWLVADVSSSHVNTYLPR